MLSRYNFAIKRITQIPLNHFQVTSLENTKIIEEKKRQRFYPTTALQHKSKCKKITHLSMDDETKSVIHKAQLIAKNAPLSSRKHGLLNPKTVVSLPIKYYNKLILSPWIPKKYINGFFKFAFWTKEHGSQLYTRYFFKSYDTTKGERLRNFSCHIAYNEFLINNMELSNSITPKYFFIPRTFCNTNWQYYCNGINALSEDINESYDLNKTHQDSTNHHAYGNFTIPEIIDSDNEEENDLIVNHIDGQLEYSIPKSKKEKKQYKMQTSNIPKLPNSSYELDQNKVQDESLIIASILKNKLLEENIEILIKFFIPARIQNLYFVNKKHDKKYKEQCIEWFMEYIGPHYVNSILMHFTNQSISVENKIRTLVLIDLMKLEDLKLRNVSLKEYTKKHCRQIPYAEFFIIDSLPDFIDIAKDQVNPLILIPAHVKDILGDVTVNMMLLTSGVSIIEFIDGILDVLQIKHDYSFVIKDFENSLGNLIANTKIAFDDHLSIILENAGLLPKQIAHNYFIYFYSSHVTMLEKIKEKIETLLLPNAQILFVNPEYTYDIPIVPEQYDCFRYYSDCTVSREIKIQERQSLENNLEIVSTTIDKLKEYMETQCSVTDLKERLDVYAQEHYTILKENIEAQQRIPQQQAIPLQSPEHLEDFTTHRSFNTVDINEKEK